MFKHKPQYRTDLASEAAETLRAGRGSGRMHGIISDRAEEDGFTTDTVRVINGTGAAAIGKPIGHYVTVGLEPFTVRREMNAFTRAAKKVASELRFMLMEQDVEDSDPVLVMGLGNESVTSDSIGPLAVRKIFATRKVAEDSGLRKVSCVSAGVLGTTGIEAAELLQGVIRETYPKAAVIVDALAAADSKRLCKSVQINDSGIIPGSGVGNSRAAMNKESLGIPVIAVGIPTVTDIGDGLIVTPRDIDASAEELGRLLAHAINIALQDALDENELRELLM